MPHDYPEFSPFTTPAAAAASPVAAEYHRAMINRDRMLGGLGGAAGGALLGHHLGGLPGAAVGGLLGGAGGTLAGQFSGTERYRGDEMRRGRKVSDTERAQEHRKELINMRKKVAATPLEIHNQAYLSRGERPPTLLHDMGPLGFFTSGGAAWHNSTATPEQLHKAIGDLGGALQDKHREYQAASQAVSDAAAAHTEALGRMAARNKKLLGAGILGAGALGLGAYALGRHHAQPAEAQAKVSGALYAAMRNELAAIQQEKVAINLAPVTNFLGNVGSKIVGGAGSLAGKMGTTAGSGFTKGLERATQAVGGADRLNKIVGGTALGVGALGAGYGAKKLFGGPKQQQTTINVRR